MTELTWQDEWPSIAPVDATERTVLPTFLDHFDGTHPGSEWIAAPRFPSAVARVEANELIIDGEQRTMDDKAPTFIGRRQPRLQTRIAATVRATTPDTVGGLSLRFDEQHHYDIELQPGRVVARAVLPSIAQEHEVPLTEATVELAFEMRTPRPGSRSSASSDLIDLIVETDGTRHMVATFDGRYLSTESACSFTGRVAGLYCRDGQQRVINYSESDRS
jgi:xylan 1,4-beta-xylosidase